MDSLTTQQLQFYQEKGIDYLLEWINNLSVVPDLSLQEHAVSLLARIIPVSPTDNLNFLCAFSLLYTHSKIPDFNSNSLEIFTAMVPEFQEKLDHFKQLHGMLLQHAKITYDQRSPTIFEEIKDITKDNLNSPNDMELISNLLQVIYLHQQNFDQFSSKHKAIACLQTLEYLNCTDADLTQILCQYSQSPCFELLISLCDDDTQTNQGVDESLESGAHARNNLNQYSFKDNMQIENHLKEDASSEQMAIHDSCQLNSSFQQQERLIHECQTPEKSHGLQQAANSYQDFKIISTETDHLCDIQPSSTLSTVNSEEVLCKFQYHGKIQSSQLTPFSLADTLF